MYKHVWLLYLRIGQVVIDDCASMLLRLVLNRGEYHKMPAKVVDSYYISGNTCNITSLLVYICSQIPTWPTEWTIEQGKWAFILDVQDIMECHNTSSNSNYTWKKLLFKDNFVASITPLSGSKEIGNFISNGLRCWL